MPFKVHLGSTPPPAWVAPSFFFNTASAAEGCWFGNVLYFLQVQVHCKHSQSILTEELTRKIPSRSWTALNGKGTCTQIKNIWTVSSFARVRGLRGLSPWGKLEEILCMGLQRSQEGKWRRRQLTASWLQGASPAAGSLGWEESAPASPGTGAGAGVRKPTALHSAACKTQRSALKTGSLFSPFPSPHWTNNTVLFAPQELNKPLSGE